MSKTSAMAQGYQTSVNKPFHLARIVLLYFLLLYFYVPLPVVWHSTLSLVNHSNAKETTSKHNIY